MTNNGFICSMLTLAKRFCMALKVWKSCVIHEAIISWTEQLWAFIVLFWLWLVLFNKWLWRSLRKRKIMHPYGSLEKAFRKLVLLVYLKLEFKKKFQVSKNEKPKFWLISKLLIDFVKQDSPTQELYRFIIINNNNVCTIIVFSFLIY